MFGTFSGGGLGMGVAFTLEDQFTKTAREIERSMSGLEDHAEIMQQKIDRSMDQMKLGAGIAGLGAVLLAPFVLGIKHASDYEENINKVSVAFKDYAGEVKAFTDNALNNFGIDKIEASNMAATFGDMATGMGMNTENAAKMSMQLVGLAGDIASFKNIEHSQANTALSGIFTGEGESLKKLGVIMNQVNLDAYLMEQGVNKSFKDMSQTEQVMTRFNYVMDRSKNSIGDFGRTADGFANQKRVFDGSIKEMSATLGEILLPIAADVFGVLGKGLKTLNSFAQSTFGRSVLIFVASLGGFLLVGGLALVLMGGMKFAAYKLAGAFGDATRAIIVKTIATQGLTAGLRAMAVAAWASIGPLVLIVAGTLAVGYAIYKIGSYFGVWEKFGAIIEAVGEIWNSFDSESGMFSISENLANKLEQWGLLDFVVELGTWVVRVKSFLIGLKEGMSSGFDVLSPIFERIFGKGVELFGKLWDIAKGVLNIFLEFSGVKAIVTFIMEKIFGIKGGLDDWKDVGRFVIDLMVFGFRAWLFLIELVIDAIIGVVDGFIWLLDWIDQGMDKLTQWGASAYEAGVNFVKNMWGGIKSIWSDVVSWVKTVASELFAPIAAPMAWIAGKVGGAWDSLFGDDEPDTPTPGNSPPVGSPIPGPTFGHHSNTSKSPVFVNNNVPKQDQAPIHNNITVQMDKEQISAIIKEEMELQESRK